MAKRNKFNLSYQVNTTCNLGQLIPIGVTEVLPGDVFNHKCSAFLRASPTDLPIMHPTHVDIRSFFVPYRLIWEGFEEFITGGDVTWPHKNYDEVLENSLDDYLGMAVGDYTQTGKSQSILPHRAYNLIYNEWWRDDQEGAPAIISTGSGTDTTTDTDLQRASWRKDRFTSARTSPQVGDAVPIPVDLGDLDVGIAKNDQGQDLAFQLKDTGGNFAGFGLADGGSRPWQAITTEASSGQFLGYGGGLQVSGSTDVTVTVEQCLSCRVNQSRKWALRVVLEQRISVQTFFVTLTYDEEHVPYRLSKRHVQLWLKQMRNYGYKFRYYACGEYGSKTRRPHYHAMLYFKSRPNLDILRVDIARAWTRGFSSVRSVDGGATARYVSKYVTKKATIEWDAQKPEWHLSSRSPGLGYEGVAAICESLLHYKYFHQCDDVPGEMEVDGNILTHITISAELRQNNIFFRRLR